MKQFTVDEKVEDPSKDLQLSSRYDDQKFLRKGCEKGLSCLELKLDEEIDSCINRLDKLERLAARYDADGIAAKNDNEMGYYQCYARAYERAKMIIEALYAQLPNVV